MRSTIPAAPAQRVYLSQMLRYSRACGSYRDFLLEDPANTEATVINGSFWKR